MALGDHVGLVGAAYAVDIERGKIRDFARAMAAPLAEFIDCERPIAPATFLVHAPYTWGYTLERPRGSAFAAIDHDLTVSLHAEERFDFFGGPPRAGERLSARPRLESVSEKTGANGGRLTFMSVLNEYRDGDGRLRAQQRSLSVTTERTPDGKTWQAHPPAYEPDYADLEPASPFARISRAKISDLRCGDSPGAIAAGPLTMQQVVRFQGVVGEDDPHHYDAAWARANGYPAPFSLGMYHASLLAGYAHHWLDPAAVTSFAVRFCNLAWPGDRLIYEGRVSEIDRQRGDCLIELTCTRQDSEDIICRARLAVAGSAH